MSDKIEIVNEVQKGDRAMEIEKIKALRKIIYTLCKTLEVSNLSGDVMLVLKIREEIKNCIDQIKQLKKDW